MAEGAFVKPPEELCTTSENPSSAWDRWRMRFDIFLKACGASEKPDVVKVGLLLNHIGCEGIDIYHNFVLLPERDENNERIPAENKDDFATIIRKFDDFFHRRDPQLIEKLSVRS